MQLSNNTAVVARRVTPPDALDFFPTPPWATRALFEHVFPVMGVDLVKLKMHGSLREPCCGLGHMSEVAREAVGAVIASDIFDYGIGAGVADFTDRLFNPLATVTPRLAPAAAVDWTVFNPPFNLAEEFVARGLETSRWGVCALVRTQWIEGKDRYFRLFKDNPPTLFAPFVERVAMVEGRWDPDASTATSYAWFCWLGARWENYGGGPERIMERPLAPFWIPPCAAQLTEPDDRQRFAPWSLADDDATEIEAVARAVCADQGSNPDLVTTAPRRDTLTYRDRRRTKPDRLSEVIQVPQWAAKVRVADDVIAAALMRESLQLGRAA